MKRSLLLSCAVLAMCGHALADEPSTDDGYEEIIILHYHSLPSIYVSGLSPQSEPILTSSVTTLEAYDLEVRDVPYLADQLRQVPGLAVSRSGAAGGLTQVRIRGAEANHTLVLFNGVEVSDPSTGETDFGLLSGLYPKRIEVARGEQSAIFGSDAVGGVINVVTDSFTGPRARLEGGSFGTYRLDAGYGLNFGDSGDVQFAFADVISEGVDTSGLGGEKDGYQNYSGTVAGGVVLSPAWEARGVLRYGYGEVDTDPDSDFDGRLENADRVTESTQVTLGGFVYGEALGLDHTIRASYNQVERENFGDGSSLNAADAARTKLAYSPSFGWSESAFDVALTGLIDWEQEDYTANDTQFGGFTNQDQTFKTLGLAGELQADANGFLFSASVRHDDNDGQFDDATTWRVGGAYLFENQGKLRVSAGAGVKNPTFTELFGFFPGSFVGNPNLVPEASTSWEIGYDHDFGLIETSLTYFEAELTDEIFTQFNPDFTSTPANRSGASERSGIEAAINWVASDGITVSGALSNITSTNESGADEIRVPEWTGSLTLNWQSLDKDGLRAGLGLDYVGEQLDTDFGTFQTVTLDAYTLVSASVEYPVNDRLSVTLRGENLLDQTVTDVFGFNGPGAGVFVGLKLR